jgi:glycosyltransferase involved in cell wall biosynthesis
MKLSIVIPVYNEEKTINNILRIVDKVKLPKEIKKREIVVVDDYSKDGTRAILTKIKNKNIKVIYHEKNQGKGAALRTGFENCTGDIIIIQDADLEYDPNEYSKLLRPILENKADVVYGSRFASGESHRVLYYWHSLGNKLLTLASNMFTDLNLTDMETCYKVFRKSVIDRIGIEENRFGFEPEITAKVGELAREENIRIFELGISYNGRTYSEGKKIGLKDAFRAFWCILKYNNSGFAHFVKYGINGILVAISQIITILVLVEYFKYNSNFGLNVSHAISVEVSIIIGIILHSFITWRHKYKSILNLFNKIFQFHLITLVSFGVRQFLFYIFTIQLSVNYFTSTIIGILIAVVLNFAGYDKIVFKKVK